MAFPTAEELTALITPVVATHHLDVEGLRDAAQRLLMP